MSACGCVYARMSAAGEPLTGVNAPPISPLVVFIARRATPALISRTEALNAAGIDAHIIADEADSLPAMRPREIDSSSEEWSPYALRRCPARVHSVDASEARRLKWTNMTAKFLKSGRDVTGWEKATLWAHGMLRADAAADAIALVSTGSGAANSACDTTNSGGASASVRPQRVVWFVEDDVWWSENALEDMITAYSTSSSDLITQRLHPTFADGPSWPHWALGSGVVPNKFWAASFNVMCRVSLRVLDAAAALARARGRLTFHEQLFPSLVNMLSAGVFKPLSKPPTILPDSSSPSASLPTPTPTPTHPSLSTLTSASSPPPPPPPPPPATVPLQRYDDAQSEWFTPPWSLGIRYRPEFTDVELAGALAETPARIFHPVKHQVNFEKKMNDTNDTNETTRKRARIT
jgi:hypothetical protein